MESEKQNNFEEQWRKAFDNASLTPSDELWGRIESELEKKKKRPFLFFLKPSLMATGLAAALVLVLGGILFFNKEPRADVAQNKIRESAGADVPVAMPSAENKKNQESLTESNQEAIALARSVPDVGAETKNMPTMRRKTPVSSNKNTLIAVEKSDNTHSNISQQAIALGNPVSLQDKTVAADLAGVLDTDKKLSATDGLAASANASISVERLDGKKYRYFGSRYTLNRNKLAFDAEANEDAENKNLASNDSKFWVGIQSGVAPFDPNMKLGSLNSMAYSAANDYAQVSNGSVPSSGDKLTVSKPQNAVKSGLAINSGVAFGYRVSDKWHFESGVRYLRGNSTLETNTYAFQNNGYVNTFLGNYLLQNSAKNYSLVNNSNTVVSDASQFGNRYEYLMIPMQMAYEIGITKKLGLNLLAGVSTDIFLQNSIFTDNGLVRGKNTIDTESKIYKPVNFSGLGGLRASYLISKHWQANIGTSYQRALFSGMSSSVDINMRMQMFGINYGFNYRF